MNIDELMARKEANPKDWEAFQKYWAETRPNTGLAGLGLAYEFWQAGQKELVKRVAASNPSAEVIVEHGRTSGKTPGGSIVMLDLTMEKGTRLYKL